MEHRFNKSRNLGNIQCFGMLFNFLGYVDIVSGKIMSIHAPPEGELLTSIVPPKR